jgi:hypothetical protein
VGPRAGEVRKILPPPGIGPRTVQPVATRYTDLATRPTLSALPLLIFTKDLQVRNDDLPYTVFTQHTKLSAELLFTFSNMYQ